MLNTSLSLESSYIPVATRRKVLHRDNHRCVWCGKTKEHDVSHFIQRKIGGITTTDNLITTCDNCKRKRHYDSPAEFIQTLKLERIDFPIDFPKEVKSMRIKVIFASGKEVEGVVNNLPKPETKAFHLHHDGNGTMELIFVEAGMRIIQLGGKT